MRLFLAAGAVVLSTASPALADTVVIGESLAQACYRSAAAHDADAAALEECDRALSEQALTARDRAATYINRGVLSLHRGRYDAALADFDAAQRLEPENAEARVNRGLVYLRQGLARDAVREITAGLEREAHQPHHALFNRAAAYEALGDAAAAYADYAAAAELAPDWSAPRAELARFTVVADEA